MDGDIAVVIPVLDDTESAVRLLEVMASWSTKPAEIVVAAGALDAALEEHCARAGCRLIHGTPNRGRQLDDGARLATASIVWFLHADAEPPADGLAAIANAIADGADGGCFRFEFQGPRTATKRALEGLISLRIRCGGIAYGDQGLFARRDAYYAAGGFSHQPLFEEVALVKRLRARGRFRVLAQSVRVATRRWERDGWWRRSLRNRWLALCYLSGIPAERLAAAYHRKP